MGLLDFFKRREKTFLDKWAKAATWSYDEQDEGLADYRIPEQLLTELYAEIGKSLQDPTNEPPELRGVYKDFPVRMRYNPATYEATYVIYNGNITLDVKVELPPAMKLFIIDAGSYEGIFVRRDPKAVAKKDKPDDPWHDENINWIFLAKKIFVKGSGDKAEKGVAFFNKLTEDLRSEILEAMETMAVESLEFNWDKKISIIVGLNKFHSLKEPVGFVLRGFDLLCKIAQEIKSVDVSDLAQTAK